MSEPRPVSRPTTLRRIEIGRLVMEIGSIEGHLVDTGAPKGAAHDGGYILMVPLTGSVRFHQNGRSGVALPDQYVLLSREAFHEITAEDHPVLLRLTIPAEDLRARLASVDDHLGRRFEVNEPMAHLMVALLQRTAEIFADRAPPSPEALANEIVGFVALAIRAEDRGATIDVRNARYRLRQRIFDYIESNLGDQDMSPKSIAGANRISLSYLYSLFSDDDTTVGQFMQMKRLQRAYELLVTDAKGHLTVAEIAYRVGFKNVSHFSRAFSRHYGLAPRNARLAAPAARNDNWTGGFAGSSFAGGRLESAVGAL